MFAPETYDGDEADSDEDNVQAKQQTVDHYPDHLPFLRGFTPLEVFVYLEAYGQEISAQLPQFIQGRLWGGFYWRCITKDGLKMNR